MFLTYYLPLTSLLPISPYTNLALSLGSLIHPPIHHPALLPCHPLTLNLPIPNTPRNLVCFVSHPILSSMERVIVSGGEGDGAFGTGEARGTWMDVECLGLVRWVYVDRCGTAKHQVSTRGEERAKENVQAKTKSPSSHCKTAVKSFCPALSKSVINIP